MAQERAQPPKLDHFKVYWVKLHEIGPVLLKGQFDREPRKVIVGPLTHFANPVSKNGAEREKGTHLFSSLLSASRGEIAEGGAREWRAGE